MGILGYAALHAPEYISQVQGIRERSAFKDYAKEHPDWAETSAGTEKAISIAPELAYSGRRLFLEQAATGEQVDRMAQQKLKYRMSLDAQSKAAYDDALSKTKEGSIPNVSEALKAANDNWQMGLHSGNELFGEGFAAPLAETWRLDDPKNPKGGYLQRLAFYQNATAAFAEKEKGAATWTPLDTAGRTTHGIPKDAPPMQISSNGEVKPIGGMGEGATPETWSMIPASEYGEAGISGPGLWQKSSRGNVRRVEGSYEAEGNKPETWTTIKPEDYSKEGVSGDGIWQKSSRGTVKRVEGSVSDKPTWITETRPDGSQWARLSTQSPTDATRIAGPGEKVMEVGGALIGYQQDENGATRVWTIKDAPEKPELVETRVTDLLSPDGKSVRTLSAASPTYEDTLNKLTGEGWTHVTRQMQGTPEDFTPKIKSDIQGEIQKAKAGIGRLMDIRVGAKREYLTMSGQLKASATAWGDWLGMNLSPESRKYLQDYTAFTTGAIDNINRYIKEITGAQMSELEADRLRKGMPDPERDGPEQFKSKLDAVLANLDRAEKRYETLLSSGSIAPGAKITPEISAAHPVIVVPEADAADLDKKYNLIPVPR